jgi:hypothetical protein
MRKKKVAVGAIEDNDTYIWIAFNLIYQRIELVNRLRISGLSQRFQSRISWLPV